MAPFDLGLSYYLPTRWPAKTDSVGSPPVLRKLQGSFLLTVAPLVTNLLFALHSLLNACFILIAYNVDELLEVEDLGYVKPVSHLESPAVGP